MNEQLENSEKIQRAALSSAAAVSDKKKPTCRLSTLSALLLLVIPAAYIVVILLESTGHRIEGVTEKIFVGFLVCSAIGSPVLAVMAKIQIALSDGRLGGERQASFVIAGFSILMVIVAGPAVSGVFRIAERIVCGTNMKGLATAIHVYADEHKGQLPTESQWCDLLITEADVSPQSFLCRTSGAVVGESSYALNKYAVGKKLSELPADMILLFETNYGRMKTDRESLLKERLFIQKTTEFVDENPEKYYVYKKRWNQVGGPEMLANNHKYGINIGYANGYSEFISFRNPNDMRELKELRWDIEKTIFSVSDYQSINDSIKEILRFPKSVIVLGSIVVAVTVFVLIAGAVWKHLGFAITLAAGASVVGYLLGGWSEAVYHPEFFKGIGTYGGASLGFLAGLCYVCLLMNWQINLHHNQSIKQLATSLGIATGMICSTLIHLALALTHHNYFFIIIGLPFGIIGGAILGFISGQVVCKYYRDEASVMIESGN